MSYDPAFVAALAEGGVNLRDQSVKSLLDDLQAVHDSCLPDRWPNTLGHLLKTHEPLT